MGNVKRGQYVVNGFNYLLSVINYVIDCENQYITLNTYDIILSKISHDLRVIVTKDPYVKNQIREFDLTQTEGYYNQPIKHMRSKIISRLELQKIC